MGSKQHSSLAGLLDLEKSKKKERKRKKVKRGKGCKDPRVLNIFSTNSAGLKSKILNCKNEIKHFDAGIFTIQETHFEKKGKFNMEDMKFLKL